MKILVIEPHPDDAFLSLGWHLEEVWKSDEKLIVTVYADDRRGREAGEYARSVGASHSCLGLAESGMNEREGVKVIPELRQEMTRLQSITWDVVLFPLGLQHPDHLRVAATRPTGAFRYVDTPYQTKLKLGDDLAGKAEGMTLWSIRFPGLRKWRHQSVFKSQAKFFHYNEELTRSRLPEIVLQ